MPRYSRDTFSKGPMFNPGAMTLAELGSAARDFGIVGTLVLIGWKGRSWVQPGIDFFNQANEFFKRADVHMTTMEAQMNLLLNNHLSHLKQEPKESEPEARK